MISFVPVIDQVMSAQDELFKLLFSLILGAVIGWERESTGHEAGIRTFSSICMGSCLFGIVSVAMAGQGDPGRISAQVVSGIGFIGVGVIIRNGGAIKGLTTAATLWSMAATGMAVAYNLYILAFMATVLTFLFLHITRAKFWHHISHRNQDHLNSMMAEKNNFISARKILIPKRAQLQRLQNFKLTKSHIKHLPASMQSSDRGIFDIHENR